MRILLKLRSTLKSRYDNEYHYNLQGFIYKMIKEGGKYLYLHNKIGHKFFCFSNIFPYSELINKDEVRNLIISSPDHSFLESLYLTLNSLSYKIVKIGKMEFEIISSQKRQILIPNSKPYSLITGTPIIMRIRKSVLSDADYDSLKNYRYYYWKKELPLEFFMSQLENTLLRKYIEFCKLKNISFRRDIETPHFFERFKFKKQVSTQIKMKNTIHKVIGTVWQFEFEGWENKKLIEFALNAGLGERNSLGFGFMNLEEKVKNFQ